MFGKIKPHCPTVSIPKLLHAFKKVMCSRYEQFFFASMKGTFHKGNASNKLISYCKFKTTYTFKNYLAVKTDKTSVSKYAKLRISNHRLNIELGRYAKTPVHLRTCNICNTLEIEDEYHFICVCHKYCDLRNQLFANIAKFIVNFDTLCLEGKFLLLLGSQQLDVNLLVLNYVNKYFETPAMHQD